MEKENMKKQWKGKDLSDQLRECGRATTVNHFNRAMDELSKINEEAHDWVSKTPTNTWAKSHFSGRAHTNCLLNNICEVFNCHTLKTRGGNNFGVDSTLSIKSNLSFIIVQLRVIRYPRKIPYFPNYKTDLISHSIV
uniref:Uncharacterized protein n=1 Tax=Lactuca sativa TaxID=4236 RepID=A0A9R1VPV4_LACSA|nr:hypothetical protein LSAT_V11C500238390 [Lactuca sativa]